jgi:flavin-dependent dehydrogenase
MKSIEIHGGGLAGLSLAAALARRGVPVRLWERHRIQRHRVCGEFICGVAPAVLQTLHIEACFDDALPLTRVHWLDRDFSLLRTELPEAARGLSRWTLDQRIAETVRKAGGEIHEGVHVRAKAAAEGSVIASGRRSQRGGWMGLKSHFKGFELEEDLEVHLGNGAYVGCSRIEGGRVNVCGLFYPRKGLSTGGPEALLAYLAAVGLEALATRLAGAEPCFESSASVAGVGFGILPPTAGSMVIGDAWAVIPPFTGNGMSMAFESARAALSPCIDYAHGRCSWGEATAAVAREHRRLFNRRMRIARLIHPLILQPRWRGFIRALTHHRLLPFCFLYRLTHR